MLRFCRITAKQWRRRNRERLRVRRGPDRSWVDFTRVAGSLCRRKRYFWRRCGWWRDTRWRRFILRVWGGRAGPLLGRFDARGGQFVQAKALFLEALRLVPRYPLALIYLADLETRQGNYREAEGYYSQVSAYSGHGATVRL